MESLSAYLQPYKSIVASLASVTTIAQFFMGSFICRDIYKTKSTVGKSATPFIGGFVLGILMLKFSFMLQDEAMIVVNVTGVVTNIVYIAFYYLYSPNKNTEVHKPLMYGIGFVTVILGYLSWEDQDLIQDRFGLIMTILMLLLMGSPLLAVNSIIEKKDASSIPFPITFGGAVVTFLWLLYSIILLNNFMIVQNLLGFLLCGIQLVLCLLYPGNKEVTKIA